MTTHSIVPPKDFQQKRQALFDILREAPHGTFYLHAALAEILEEPAGSSRYRSLIVSTSKWLEREAQRTLVCTRGAGYRIAAAAEHLQLTHKRHLRSFREKKRGYNILVATDVQQLGPHERQRVADRLVLEQEQLRMMQKIRTSLARINQQQEEAIEAANREKVTLLDSKIEEIIQRLEKMKGA